MVTSQFKDLILSSDGSVELEYDGRYEGLGRDKLDECIKKSAATVPFPIAFARAWKAAPELKPFSLADAIGTLPSVSINRDNGDEIVDPYLQLAADVCERLERGNITANAKEEEYTDVGNANRFIHRHGKDTRYCYQNKTWYIWNGCLWEPDVSGHMMSMAKDTAIKIAEEATISNDSQKVMKWASRSQEIGRLNAMICLSECEVPVLLDELDTATTKINMHNGVLDLNDFSFHCGGIKEELHTLSTRVDYKQGAKCPKWLEHLKLVFGDDAQMIETFQIACGYSLIGTSSEFLFIDFGNGRNGKGVSMQTITRILGGYGIAIDPETILELRKKGGADAKEDLVRLKGKRIVYASEPSRSLSLNTSLIKQFTGGDPIVARPLYGKLIEFNPSMTIWLNTNHQPIIKESTDAIKARLRMFPFEKVIPEEMRRDPNVVIEEFVTEEGSGIFNWVLEGLKKFRANRNQIPFCDKVKCATQEMFLHNDTVGRCISELTVMEDNAMLEKGVWHYEYQKWCEENDEEWVTKKALTALMIEHGFKEYRQKTGRSWVGIRLKRAGEEEMRQLQ